MARWSKRILLGLALGAAAGFLACRLLWPEHLAINAPMGPLLFGTGNRPDPEAVAHRIRVPAGFDIAPFASIPNARGLAVTPTDDLLVSTPRSGEVWLVLGDRDGDGHSDGQRPILESLNRPHGLAIHEGWLYVGETDAVLRVRFDPETGRTSEPERIVTGLPGDGNHWSRTLRFGPDGLLYLTVGSSCNVCLETDARRATMLRFRADGSGYQIFATGLRNAVGFDWRPGTEELYATDNGRDLLGDDFPPCELNRVVRGGFYGWPQANGDRVPDPEFGSDEAVVSTSIPPAHAFRPHNAPLGIHFVRSPDAPEAIRGAALVALHGSWNRTRKDGYKVVSLHWAPDGSIEERDFVWGFLEDENVIGRPVEIAEDSRGAFYLSDDLAGEIYRVSPGPSSQAARRPKPSPPPLARAPLPAGELAERSVRGAALYEANACAGCHETERAEAGVVVVPLQNLAERHDVATLVALLATPTPPMPLYDLSEEQRLDLASYLLERPEPPR